jgi:hypothetical protein
VVKQARPALQSEICVQFTAARVTVYQQSSVAAIRER